MFHSRFVRIYIDSDYYYSLDSPSGYFFFAFFSFHRPFLNREFVTENIIEKYIFFVNNKYFSLVIMILLKIITIKMRYLIEFKFKFKFSNSDSNWIRKFWLKFFNSNQNSHFFQLSFSILTRKKTRRMKI